MAARIVDVFEVIKIDQDERNVLAGTGDAYKTHFQQFDQGRAVPQICQRVTACHQLDLAEGAMTGNDIIEYRLAHYDDAEVEDANKNRKHYVHDVSALKQ